MISEFFHAPLAHLREARTFLEGLERPRSMRHRLRDIGGRGLHGLDVVERGADSVESPAPATRTEEAIRSARRSRGEGNAAGW